jgi:hypothetical protein
MKKIFYFVLILTAISFQTSGQVDTVMIKKLATEQYHVEKKIIALLKNIKVGSSLKYFSANYIKQIGQDSLKELLCKIILDFIQYPDTTHEISVGISKNGIGTFGHDTQGNIELKSSYCFFDKKGNLAYILDLYYNDSGNIGEIKNVNFKYVYEWSKRVNKLFQSIYKPNNNVKKK